MQMPEGDAVVFSWLFHTAVWDLFLWRWLIVCSHLSLPNWRRIAMLTNLTKIQFLFKVQMIWTLQPLLHSKDIISRAVFGQRLLLFIVIHAQGLWLESCMTQIGNRTVVPLHHISINAWLQTMAPIGTCLVRFSLHWRNLFDLRWVFHSRLEYIMSLPTHGSA